MPESANEQTPRELREAELEKYGDAKLLIEEVHRLSKDAESIVVRAKALKLDGHSTHEFPPQPIFEMWQAAVIELRDVVTKIP